MQTFGAESPGVGRGARVALSAGDMRGRAPLPLPATAPVGRERELAAVTALLVDDEVRLVTLTGPPGVGKTFLAVTAARAVAGQFPAGATFVDLTPVRDPDLVAAEIGAALGRSGAEQHQLLVVDNFEHVLDAVPELAGLLSAFHRLTVLVTSRERLHLRAEREVPVPPLALPGPAERADPALFAATASVQLLLRQVRAYQPGFAVTDANRDALAEICVRLDGLPLAMELAAPRLRLFTPEELTFRLRSRVTLLASDARDVPDRHRTLRSALAWSHDLLRPEERVAFRQLSVFAGGWTLDAARRVCAVEVPDAAIASLVDKSLVRRLGSAGNEAAGEAARFGMLESLREFAAELLDRETETEETRQRHAEYFAALAARTDARIGTVDERAAVEGVGPEAANLRTALAWTMAQRRHDLTLPLASALGWYCYTRGRLGEGAAVLEAAIAATADGNEAPGEALAAVMFMAGAVALARGQLEDAEDRLTRSLELNERNGSLRRKAIATAFLGHLARARGRPEEAVSHHEQAAALHGELGSRPGVAWSRYDLGLLARTRGEDARAAEQLRAAIAAFRDMGYAWAIACASWALATVDLQVGALEEARTLLADALTRFEATDDGRGVAQTLEATAAVACDGDRHADAVRLLGAATTLRGIFAAPLPDEETGTVEAIRDRARRELGVPATDAAERAGRAMPLPTVLTLARDLLAGADRRSVPFPRRAVEPLTGRERQVANLVRLGRTNRQIGRELGISEKTAEVHVHNIIRKLGAGSRAEIAAWVAGGPEPGVP